MEAAALTFPLCLYGDCQNKPGCKDPSCPETSESSRPPGGCHLEHEQVSPGLRVHGAEALSLQALIHGSVSCPCTLGLTVLWRMFSGCGTSGSRASLTLGLLCTQPHHTLLCSIRIFRCVWSPKHLLWCTAAKYGTRVDEGLLCCRPAALEVRMVSSKRREVGCCTCVMGNRKAREGPCQPLSQGLKRCLSAHVSFFFLKKCIWFCSATCCSIPAQSTTQCAAVRSACLGEFGAFRSFQAREQIVNCGVASMCEHTRSHQQLMLHTNHSHKCL